MFLVSHCSCLWPIHWSLVTSKGWRCSWSSTDNFNSYYVTAYIRGLTVSLKARYKQVWYEYGLFDLFYYIYLILSCICIVLGYKPLSISQNRDICLLIEIATLKISNTIVPAHPIMNYSSMVKPLPNLPNIFPILGYTPLKIVNDW